MRLLRQMCGKARICAMVKADAYGHGADLAVKALEGMKVAFWGVATLNEAVKLRDLKVGEPIIVMRPFARYDPEKEIVRQIRLMHKMQIRPTLVGDDVVELLSLSRSVESIPIKVHVKVDTGMGRNGCPADEAAALVGKLAAAGVTVEGVYSHFACSSADNPDFSREQVNVFRSILRAISALKIKVDLRHMANSSAIFSLPRARFDMVRPGKALYGYSDTNMPASHRLAPVMRVEAPVVFVKWMKKGAFCGYDCAFRAPRATRIGLLPVGYADGYSRKWSNCGIVDFQGKQAPVIGRISMDLTMVDLTDIPGAGTGSRICLVSNRRSDPHSMESLATRLDTIPHEIGCRFGNRIQRVLVA